jgi:hypothetical protein
MRPEQRQATGNVQDFLPEARQFQLEVWTPREALRRLRSA